MKIYKRKNRLKILPPITMPLIINIANLNWYDHLFPQGRLWVRSGRLEFFLTKIVGCTKRHNLQIVVITTWDAQNMAGQDFSLADISSSTAYMDTLWALLKFRIINIMSCKLPGLIKFYVIKQDLLMCVIHFLFHPCLILTFLLLLYKSANEVHLKKAKVVVK